MPNLENDYVVVLETHDALLKECRKVCNRFNDLACWSHTVFKADDSSRIGYETWRSIKKCFGSIKRDFRLNHNLIYFYQKMVECGIRNLMAHLRSVPPAEKLLEVKENVESGFSRDFWEWWNSLMWDLDIDHVGGQTLGLEAALISANESRVLIDSMIPIAQKLRREDLLEQLGRCRHGDDLMAINLFCKEYAIW